MAEEDDSPRIGVVCFSGGKDSTAMLIRLLELDDPDEYPVTRIIFADTGFEFQELYDYITTVQAYIDDRWPEKGLQIEYLEPVKDWNVSFYGKVVRGANEGKVRGPPLYAYPCYHARDAKVKPLQRASKDADMVYVGIAADESHRATNNPKSGTERNRYPLVEWGWTEQDCHDYLDKLAIVNHLYMQFRRLGCYHCIKQPLLSWHTLWRDYPDLWKKSKYWDAEGLRVAGRGLRDDYTLEELEKRFEGGWIPKGKKPYECNSCVAVGMVAQGHLSEEDFDTDGAFEHDPEIAKKIMEIEQRGASDDDWIKEEDVSCDAMSGLTEDEIDP